MWLTRRDVVGIAAAAASAGSVRAATPPLRLPKGLALDGFDAVSYFLAGDRGPRPGRAAFELNWHGQAWRFSSAANLEAFRRDPDVYAPRLGAFDPVGILEGRLVDTDPLVFAILPGPGGDRLYLFRTDATRARLVAQRSLVFEAEVRWPKLAGLTDADLPNR